MNQSFANGTIISDLYCLLAAKKNMTDYAKIKAECERGSAVSSEVVDKHLIYYAARRDGVDKEMDRKLAAYKHITRTLESSWINLLKSQYIAHRIFRAQGLLKKYLNHSEIKALPGESREYLEHQLNHPWRFSFSMLTGNPAPDFYEMIDVFSGEEFLLYSRSVSAILAGGHPRLWFMLRADNGECWQTFGPVMHYKAFDPDDLFFFATELNPDIETEAQFLAHVEANPIPYMMLISGSNLPPVVHGDDELVQVMAWFPLSAPFHVEGLEETDSPVEEVRKLELPGWSGHPHFAVVYCDELQQELQLQALTMRGFQHLVKELHKAGYPVPEEPDVRVHVSMITTAGSILKREIQLDEYAELFEQEPNLSPAGQETLDKLNELLRLALPAMNSGQQPDAAALARQVGLDEEQAREMLASVWDQVNEMKNRKF